MSYSAQKKGPEAPYRRARWPKATGPPQELEVWGAERPKLLVFLELVFLDLVISINKDGFLQTDLHTKPNTKNSLLLPSSCHPPAVTRGSVYGLVLRVNRNCSTQEAADLRYEELAARLRQREYPETIISAGRR